VATGGGRKTGEKEGREQPINVAVVFLKVLVFALTQRPKEARERPFI